MSGTALAAGFLRMQTPAASAVPLKVCVIGRPLYLSGVMTPVRMAYLTSPAMSWISSESIN